MNSSTASNTSYVNTLMVHYCLELEGQSARSWINQWLEDHPIDWITLAVIEALYLGRYKAVSVEQILCNWKRRGQPSLHFSKEFERVISRRFPRNLRSLAVRQTELLPPPVPQPNLDHLEVQDPGIRAVLQEYLAQQRSVSYDLKAPLQPMTPLLIDGPLNVVEAEEPISLSQDLKANSEPLTETEPTVKLASEHNISGEDIPDIPSGEDIPPPTRPLSRWLAMQRVFQVPLFEEAPIVQFVPEPVQAGVLEKLKAISKASFPKGHTFELIESLMAKPL